MLGMEMPVSGVWAKAEIVSAQKRRGRIRRARLIIVGCSVLAESRPIVRRIGPDHYRLCGEGVFEAGTLRSEHFASVFRDVPVVFEADAEFAGDIDAGFVGEAHAGGERSGVAADEIGPFVAVHTDAVAEAGGEGFGV